jgi:hypothetical protein
MKRALAVITILAAWIPVSGQQAPPPQPKILGMGVERKAEAVMPEPARMGETGILYTTVQINPNGSLGTSDPVVERKSGKKDLDDDAIAATRASSPFDPLPSQFHGPYLKLRLVFMYNRVQLHAR